jgi:hypothetical protein
MLERIQMKNLKLAVYILVINGALAFLGCSSNKDDAKGKISLGLNALKPIVSASAPTVFGASSSGLVSLKSLENKSTDEVSAMSLCDGAISSADKVRACLYDQILTSDLPANVAVGQWYLHWINNLDSNVQELNTRFETKPTCLESTPIDISFDLDTLVGPGESLPSVGMKLQCREVFSSTDSSQHQDGAFGISNDKIFYVTRSRSSNGNQRSYMLVLAQSDVNGTEARIWVVLASGRAGILGDEDVSIMRINANKTTKSFAVERITTNGNNNRLTNFIAIADGLNLKLIADNIDSSGSLNECVLANNAATAGSCGSLTSFPVGVDATQMSLGTSAFYNVGNTRTALNSQMDSTSVGTIEASPAAAFTADSVLQLVPNLIP